MHPIRPTVWSLALSLLLIGCGTGVETPPTLSSVALSGTIVQVDGQTLDRSGVTVAVRETGQRFVTAPDGRFAFSGIPAGSVTLSFDGSEAQLSHGDGREAEFEDELEDELEDESDEDDSGNPVLKGLREGDRSEIRVVLMDGRVVEFSSHRSEGLFSMAHLTRAAGSPDPDVEGKVRLQTRPGRQKFSVETEHLAPGTGVEIHLDLGSGFSVAGSAIADAFGVAEFERDTGDGDFLPLGATSLAALEGLDLEVRLAANGDTLLAGVVPDLPDGTSPPGTSPPAGGRGRGVARLFAEVAGLEGSIDVRSRPDHGEERFKMEAEHLLPGEIVIFQIEDPATPGLLLTLATVAADSEGEAEINTQDGLKLPGGVTSVDALAGLEVRIIAGDGSGTLLLAGRVPALVAD